MAGQIGFFLESFTAEPRPSAPDADRLQGDSVSGGDEFRQKLNELNAEGSAERTFAQSPEAASSELSDLASKFPSDLPKAKTASKSGEVQRVSPDAQNAQAAQPSVPDDFEATLALALSPSENEPSLARLDSRAIEPSNITATVRPDLTSQKSPQQTPTGSDLLLQAAEPALKAATGTLPSSNQDVLQPAEVSTAAHQDLTTPLDLRVSRAQESSSGVAIQPDLKDPAVAVDRSSTTDPVTRAQNPLTDSEPFPAQSPEINNDIGIRQLTDLDTDVPSASSQQRPTHLLPQVQEVPAFTPFQQRAATALPSDNIGAAAAQTAKAVSQANAINAVPAQTADAGPYPNPIETVPTTPAIASGSALSSSDGANATAPRAPAANASRQDTIVLPAQFDSADPATQPARSTDPENAASVARAAIENTPTSQVPPEQPRLDRELKGSNQANSNVTSSSFAPSQAGTPELASKVPVSANTPILQQNDAAVLPGQTAAATAGSDQIIEADVSAPQAADAKINADPKVTNEAITQISSQPLAADTATGEIKPLSVEESVLGTSQSSPGQSAVRVQAPAFAAQLQQAGAVIPQAQVADIPNVLSDALSLEDGSKKITVQLDPPELGRVSIDFKFDGNVLQSVLVTGETPEAMRRLRLMHFELVQTLEQHGFSGQDLDFSQRGDERRAQNMFQQFEDRSSAFRQEDTIDLASVDHPVTRQMIASEGLDLKL